MESLEQIKQNFANNLQTLRKQNGLTQLDLAEKLQYSDKAISKWERGESVPDAFVLKCIADTFSVSVDYLIEAEHAQRTEESVETRRFKIKNRAIITAMSIAVVWLVALTTFVTASMVSDGAIHLWLSFVYAVPISAIVWLVMNSIWFNRRRNFFIISLLIWAVLASLYFTVMFYSARAWELFLLGVPGQIIIIFWSRIKPKEKKSR